MIETSFTEIIIPKQKWGEEELNFDPDSSPKAWDHYKKYYKKCGVFSEDLILVTTTKNNYRLKSKVSIGDVNCEIAGDCSFNFNCIKEDIYKSIIDNDPRISDDDKKNLKQQLTLCYERHHTLLNFDLVPVTGGLNNLKGNLKIKDNRVMVHDVGKPPKNGLLDRMDTFISFIDYTFHKRDEFARCQNANLKAIGEFFSNSIFTTSMRYENFPLLYDLLKNYDNIYDYCEIYYNINDKDYIKELIENGKKPIATAKDIENYMNLAIKFWEQKEKYFNKPENNSKE